METNELFIISVRYITKKNKIKLKTIAENLGFDPKHLSSFLNKTRGFSEERKEQIAKYLGTTYLDMLILGKELSSKSAESAHLTPTPKNEPSALLGNHAADDHPGAGSDAKQRMIQKITQMLEQMEEEDTRDIERMSAEKLEKKRIKQELETIRRELRERKAG